MKQIIKKFFKNSILTLALMICAQPVFSAVRTVLVKQEESIAETGIQKRATDPVSPVLNQIWLNTTQGLIKYYDGSLIVSLTAGGGDFTAGFYLDGATVPFTAISGPHYQKSNQTLNGVYISMLDRGTAGSTQIRVNQYRAGVLHASATASIAASSGNPGGVSAALSSSLSLLAADIISVDVVSVASGTPEGLSVEY